MAPLAMDALVLSGGTIERERFEELDREILRKAEIPLLGRSCLEWVLAGLRECSSIQRIVVVGHPELARLPLATYGASLTPERQDITTNLGAGLEALGDASSILALSGDLPLVGFGVLDRALAQMPEADLVFPIVEREHIDRAFPDRKWIYVKTQQGRFTGSSMALINGPAIRERWGWVERLLNARRSVPQLAAMFGARFAWGVFTGSLDLAFAEQRVGDILKMSARSAPVNLPEVAMDIDKFGDIELAERWLRRQPTGAQ